MNMKCKKILAYGMLSFSLLQAVPFNCMAYPLQDEYIQQFGDLTQSTRGLHAIIEKLNEVSVGKGYQSYMKEIREIDTLQEYLSKNYERFKPYISGIDYKDVEWLAFYYTEYPLEWDYIEQFGNLIESNLGLQAIINKLNEADGKRPYFKISGIPSSTERCRMYLSDHYERFKPHISSVTYEEVNLRLNDLKEKGKKINQKRLKREKEELENRLAGFDLKSSIAVQRLEERFGGIEELRMLDLLSIAESAVASSRKYNPKLEVRIDREARRRKLVLLKWFDENWEVIGPFLNFITLV